VLESSIGFGVRWLDEAPTSLCSTLRNLVAARFGVGVARVVLPLGGCVDLCQLGQMSGEWSGCVQPIMAFCAELTPYAMIAPAPRLAANPSTRVEMQSTALFPESIYLGLSDGQQERTGDEEGKMRLD
jgi:hypothetical protein